ncbi:zf-HC2 domain-containing protein [Paenibacillaceae bacterium]|nr:zf-HC2 domain-containing protein [Paenibacillaceae bacterium]
MKCQDVCDAFGLYWDLPANDPERVAVDQHLLGCVSCAEQFRIWEECEAAIRDLANQPILLGPVDHINRSVMDRIYSEESWFKPAKPRRKPLSALFRRNAYALVACCMTIFAIGFLYFLFGQQTGSSNVEITGMLDTVKANDGISLISTDFYKEVPMASISDPVVLKASPAIPGYLVALCLLGVLTTMLTLNWLSRTRRRGSLQ